MSPGPAGEPAGGRAAATALQRALLVSALAAGTWLRLAGLGARPLFGDEHHALPLLAAGWRAVWTGFDAYGSHVGFPLLQLTSLRLLGESPWSLRLPSALAGVLALPSIYLLGRRLVGPSAAVLATAALALSPMPVYYARFGRPYALAGLLGIWLVLFLDAAARTRRPAAWAGVALSAGLLACAHLSTLGAILALALAAAALGVARARSPRGLLGPAAAFGAAGLLALAFHAPSWSALAEYRRAIPTRPTALDASEWLGVLDLLAGGRGLGIVLLAAVALGLAGLARRRPPSALWIAAAVLGPLAHLWLARPSGTSYAYARYLLVALPPSLLAAAWVPVALAEGLARPAAGGGERRATTARAVAVLAGTAALVGALLRGPLGPDDADDGVLDNTYLALRRLPAFDRPWPGASAIYAELARDPAARTVVECPPLRTRTAMLYRNHRLRHGKRVLIGTLEPGEDPPAGGPTGGPYVPARAAALAACGADYLVLHRRVTREARLYWDWVYGEVWPALEHRADRPFMTRQRLYDPPASPGRPVEERLRAELGEPYLRDELVTVWKLD